VLEPRATPLPDWSVCANVADVADIEILEAPAASYLLHGSLLSVGGTRIGGLGFEFTRRSHVAQKEAYDLHMRILYWCCGIAVVVFGAMIYSLIKFRKSVGAKPDTNMLHSTNAEIVWTVIPIIILVVMAVPAARALIKIEDTRNAEITIKVTGYQWKWEYDYQGQNVKFFSTLARDSNAARQLNSGQDPNAVPNYLLNVDKPMVVPEKTKVRLLVTSADVIHAWWVPDFGVKKDANPGFINELWINADHVGTFRGQCAELCGRDHGFMPIVVEVKTKEEYQAWLKSQQPAETPTAEAAPAPAQ
jgi:cytochrome c oxidase subunit 2